MPTYTISIEEFLLPTKDCPAVTSNRLEFSELGEVQICPPEETATSLFPSADEATPDQPLLISSGFQVIPELVEV
ncbi:MAG: hypothetical protein EBZ36_08895 [Acidobacteria bacterium]|nr:hypothetical protein [Acidobacteriota bacterium]